MCSCPGVSVPHEVSTLSFNPVGSSKSVSVCRMCSGCDPTPSQCPLLSLDLLERGYEVHVLTDGASSQRLADRGERWLGCLR